MRLLRVTQCHLQRLLLWQAVCPCWLAFHMPSPWPASFASLGGQPSVVSIQA